MDLFGSKVTSLRLALTAGTCWKGMRGSESVSSLLRVKKRIGIKYCGGCNPGYERVEMIERVQFGFDNRFLFLRHDELDIDALVLMSGCQRACAAKDLNLKKIPHCLVAGENDFHALINWLKSLDRKGDFWWVHQTNPGDGSPYTLKIIRLISLQRPQIL